MRKQDTLRPVDVPVVLALALLEEAIARHAKEAPGEKPPAGTFDQLGTVLGMSASTVFESVRRLRAAGLVRPDTRKPNYNALREFLVHGARYAFPPALGRQLRGVPTAHAGPALRELFDDDQPVVWPDADGPVRGTALAPLYPKAVELPERAPEVYRALTLVDALRVGQARERKAAIEALEATLSGSRDSESTGG